MSTHSYVHLCQGQSKFIVLYVGLATDLCEYHCYSIKEFGCAFTFVPLLSK
jgi:hypothetical protein